MVSVHNADVVFDRVADIQLADERENVERHLAADLSSTEVVETSRVVKQAVDVVDHAAGQLVVVDMRSGRGGQLVTVARRRVDAGRVDELDETELAELQ